jgi:SAM-dependent methyltransferase
MRLTLVLLLTLGSFPAAGQKPLQRDLREHEKTLAPFVLSPQPIVDRMLELANLRAGELVYDLGCGDGRILITAAQKYKARGVGIEISPKLVEMTTALVKRLGLDGQIQIRLGNILETKFSDADVVTLYLETNSNELLRPAMEKQLRPGTRVVSHDFEVRGWRPVMVDKIEAFHRKHTIYLYEIGGPVQSKNPLKKKRIPASAARPQQ